VAKPTQIKLPLNSIIKSDLKTTASALRLLRRLMRASRRALLAPLAVG